MKKTKNKGKGLSILIGAGILLALIMGVSVLLESADKPLYDAGHKALLNQDCAAAIDAFDQVIGRIRIIDVSFLRYSAEREKDQCQQYQRASEQQTAGAQADAVIGYYNMILQYPDSALVTPARAHLEEMLVGLFSLDHLASDAFCKQLEDIGSSHALGDEQTYAAYPKVVDACARFYENAGDNASAVRWYDAFIKKYSGNDWSDTFRSAMALDLIYDAQGRSSGGLDAPVAVGDGNGLTFVLNYYNDSPQKLRLVLNGPKALTVDLPACSGCKQLTAPPNGCAKQGKPTRVVLPPGAYQVLVVAGSGDTTQSYLSNWQMESAQYEGCFYQLGE